MTDVRKNVVIAAAQLAAMALPVNIEGNAFATDNVKIVMDLVNTIDLASAFTFFDWNSDAPEKDRILIVGDADAELFKGSQVIDDISAGSGNDTLDGGLELDVLRGGLGDDLYIIDQDGEAKELAGQGNDTVESSLTYVLGSNLENLVLTGAGDISGTGNGLANSITGNSGSNTINGGSGADTMTGGAGNDRYIVTAGDVIIEAIGGGTDTAVSEGSTTLADNVERLTLTGTKNAAGTGNALANVIIGNSGINNIDGKGSSDILTGGAGGDRFFFTTVLDPVSNVDKITDFTVGLDQIRLDDAIFTGLATGVLSSAAFHIGTSAADASDRIIYNSTNGALYFDSDGVGGVAQLRFATLDPGLALNNTDLIVF